MHNLKEIGLDLTEKSPKIMRSRLIIFNLTASISGIYGPKAQGYPDEYTHPKDIRMN